MSKKLKKLITKKILGMLPQLMG